MSRLLRLLFFAGDLLLLNLAVSFSISSYQASAAPEAKIYLFIFSNLAWLFLVMVSTPYNVNKGWKLSRTIKSQLAFVFIHLLILASLVTFLKQDYPIIGIVFIYLVFIPGFFAFRIMSLYLRKIFTKEQPYLKYIIIGRNDLARDLRRYFAMNPEANYKFVADFDFGPGNFPLQEIQEFSVEHGIHEIYCCVSELEPQTLQQLIEFGLDSLIKVKVVVGTSEESLRLNRFDKPPGLDLATVRLDDRRNQLVKRVFDVFFAVLFHLLISWWLFPIIAIAIKIDSRGPVFFVQLRSGRGNKPFKCLKFRTMVVNSESDVKQASRNDTRITKLGHFLRKTSIDELPQFINVLNGTMSVVGPRPHMLKHTEEYSMVIDRFMGRHYVKPGITGLAQCLGYRGETKDLIDMENRVRMDRYYIENWTFWFDIKIIFLTIISLIRGSDKAF